MRMKDDLVDLLKRSIEKIRARKRLERIYDLPKERMSTPTIHVDLAAAMAERLIGQPAAIDAIVPFIQIHQAGISPEERPVGVFMLLGSSGIGKTRTCEVLAEVLHGTSKKFLKVDCGEYQMEHEVAKLVGAPPGYLGHRETQPLLSQQRLNNTTSETSKISIVLFDEIEKAAPSMARMLLGVLDKGSLRLGDNNTVSFENSIIFLTSNLGSAQIAKALKPTFGFEACVESSEAVTNAKIKAIGTAALRRKFSPEFVNRIDAVVTYKPLTSEGLALILEQQLIDLELHLMRRLGMESFTLSVSKAAKKFLLRNGTSVEFGARELKRTIQRSLIQPMAIKLTANEIPAGCVLVVDVNSSRSALTLRVQPGSDLEKAA
jgi:ATP-dependent Clp protease ATP-binding subunit ClpA